MGRSTISEQESGPGPFGLSFVDMVACALVGVIALLIVWLQLINPLGLLPGVNQTSVPLASNLSVVVAKPLDENGPPNEFTRLPSLVLVRVEWPVESKATSEQASVEVALTCNTGSSRMTIVRPESNPGVSESMLVLSAGDEPRDCRSLVLKPDDPSIKDDPPIKGVVRAFGAAQEFWWVDWGGKDHPSSFNNPFNATSATAARRQVTDYHPIQEWAPK